MYFLLTKEGGHWKPEGQATGSYGEMTNNGNALDPDIEWMIVEVKRYNSGKQSDEVQGNDVGKLKDIL